ncbi:MAG: ABC transporter ATP-binding protein [Actinobacteria bacterium]|nr:ABC transporter ATP-binding protein [Actinomycetota bacterium]
MSGTTGNDALIKLEGIKKAFYTDEVETHALADVHMAIAEGEYVAISGPSGCGKTTLLSILGLLDTPTDGTYTLAGEAVAGLSAADRARVRNRQIGFIFQAFNLIPTLTAYENIVLPLTLGKKKGDETWINRVIDTINLRDRLTHRPSELSGGQQQRVAIARALASQPDIIFADEPTGNLDSKTGTEVLTFMRRAVSDLGQTIVMVTHDATAASYADRIVFLADGKVAGEMFQPTAQKVLDYLKHLGE